MAKYFSLPPFFERNDIDINSKGSGDGRTFSPSLSPCMEVTRFRETVASVVSDCYLYERKSINRNIGVGILGL